MENYMLRPLSEILKELQLINQDLKDHNDRMDEKYERSILPTSDAGTTRTGNQTTGDDK
jgi:hypothetical protein